MNFYSLTYCHSCHSHLTKAETNKNQVLGIIYLCSWHITALMKKGNKNLDSSNYSNHIYFTMQMEYNAVSFMYSQHSEKYRALSLSISQAEQMGF